MKNKVFTAIATFGFIFLPGLSLAQPGPLAQNDVAALCPAADDIASMTRQMAILEREKEDLREKLLQTDSGAVKPVYQCAKETKEIADLQAQVKYLENQNEDLQRKNQDLSMPKQAAATGPGKTPPPGMNAPTNPEGGDQSPPEDLHRDTDAQTGRSAPDVGLGRDRAERLDDEPANSSAAVAKSLR